MKADNITIGKIEDKIVQCENQYIEAHTDFLDSHQQSLARGVTNKRKSSNLSFEYYGGYPDAERCILICLPDYESLENVNPLKVIRAVSAAGGRELTHRDYLGAIMALGIKREMIGDILVSENSADIIVLQDICEYLVRELARAGRTYLQLSSHDICDLKIPELKRVISQDTVASMRIDNIVSSAFGLPRSKAAEAINRGLVFVNHIEISKVDFQVSEGDSIVLRHKGKVRLIETGGTSRKGRLYISYEKY